MNAQYLPPHLLNEIADKFLCPLIDSATTQKKRINIAKFIEFLKFLIFKISQDG